MNYEADGVEFGHVVHGEVRALKAVGEEVTLTGVAAVFDKWAQIGPIRERIAPGAFKAALKSSDVRLLVNHEGLPLARTTSGTMELRETDRGLEMEARLDRADPDVRALIPKIERGDLSQFSFAFDVTEAGQTWDGMDRTIRSFSEIFDVSLVTFPAFESTKVTGLRSLKKFGLDVAVSDQQLSRLREVVTQSYF